MFIFRGAIKIVKIIKNAGGGWQPFFFKDTGDTFKDT